MRKTPTLLAAMGLAVSIVLIDLAPSQAVECSPSQIREGHCQGPSVGGTIGNGGVDLSGSQGGTGGNAGSGHGSGSGNSGSGSGSNNSGGGRPGGTGGSGGQTPPPRDGYTVTMPGDNLPRAVTLADLVNFRPHAAIHRMEPNGWMVVGLATNFYAESSAHVLDGQLLGRPASVRFTPRAYHWSYGDGTAATLPSKGASWSTLRIAEFDPTPTSHVYRESGTYNVDLSIDFAPEYRFAGGPWTGIPGVLRIPANRLVITAGDAKTVLVERECTLNPTGPGC